MKHTSLLAIVLAACGAPNRGAIDASPGHDAAADGPIDAAVSPDPIAALQQMPPVCDATSGWCWLDPRPMGDRWTGSYASAPDNLWLTAAPTFLFHWDGAAWTPIQSPQIPQEYVPLFQSDVDVISGSTATDMWFVIGAGVFVYHYDGATFDLRAEIPFPAQSDAFLSGVWEAPDTDDKYVCADHELWHASGSAAFFPQLEPAVDPGCSSIWGVAHDDFWITTSGVPYHFDGTTFTAATDAPFITGMLGAAANDIWAHGPAGFAHYDGTAWTTVIPTPKNTAGRIASVAAGDAWFTVEATAPHSYTVHWDGTAATEYDQPLVEQPLSNLPTFVDGRLLAPAEAGTFYVAEPGQTLLTPALNPNYEGYNQMWPDPDGSFWVAGVGQIFHFDHDQMFPEPTGTTFNMKSISGARVGSTLEVISVGQLGSVKHFDGTTWTSSTIATGFLNGVWVAQPGSAIVVGAGGVAFRWDGTAYTPIATGVTTELFGVWGPDPDHAFAVGAGGVILAWSSAAPDVMTPVASPTTTELRQISGIGAGGTVWMAGDKLFEGDFAGGFSDITPHNELFRSVFALSATEAYIGGQKRLYRVTNGAVTEEALPLDIRTGVAIAVSPKTGERLAGTALGALLVHP